MVKHSTPKPIEFHCHNCGAHMQAPRSHAGGFVRCPECGTEEVPVPMPRKDKRRRAAERRRPGRTSVGALVVANLVPLFGVVFLGWDAGEMCLLYWAENIVIGSYTILKLMFVKEKGSAGCALLWSKVFLAAMFVIHFGSFCGLHGAGVLAIAVGGETLKELPVGENTSSPLYFVQLLVGVIILGWRTLPEATIWPLVALFLHFLRS